MAKKGDVFSIDVSSGLAYFQFFGKVPPIGALIRVLPGIFDDRPSLEALVAEETNFWIFFPVDMALNKNLISKMGSYSIPQHSSDIPLFRTGVVDSSTGRIENWWLWDGKNEWKVGRITEAQRKLPIKGIWNDTMLIERIVGDWLPEKDTR